MTAIAVTELTQSTIDGTGVFDVLMKATKAHLESEFTKGRIKGTEYSTVYLGSLEQTMQTALAFLVQSRKISLEADLLEQQILLAQAEVAKANAQIALAEKELLQADKKLELMTKEVDLATAKLVNLPKEGALLDAQANMQSKQAAHVEAETLNVPKQGLLIDAQKAVQTQQAANLASEKLSIEGRTELVAQQTTNAVIEGTVLTGQKCKLDAEYDLLLGQTLKTAQETSLLSQKVVTERAQVSAIGVDADSVVGKQKALYAAQTNGFSRDAEQKAAKTLIDTWNVRRTTDEATVADGTNLLNDATIGRAVTKLLEGVGA
jgi:hypothetical protein